MPNPVIAAPVIFAPTNHNADPVQVTKETLPAKVVLPTEKPLPANVQIVPDYDAWSCTINVPVGDSANGYECIVQPINPPNVALEMAFVVGVTALVVGGLLLSEWKDRREAKAYYRRTGRRPVYK